MIFGAFHRCSRRPWFSLPQANVAIWTHLSALGAAVRLPERSQIETKATLLNRLPLPPRKFLPFAKLRPSESSSNPNTENGFRIFFLWRFSRSPRTQCCVFPSQFLPRNKADKVRVSNLQKWPVCSMRFLQVFVRFASSTQSYGVFRVRIAFHCAETYVDSPGCLLQHFNRHSNHSFCPRIMYIRMIRMSLAPLAQQVALKASDAGTLLAAREVDFGGYTGPVIGLLIIGIIIAVLTPPVKE